MQAKIVIILPRGTAIVTTIIRAVIFVLEAHDRHSALLVKLEKLLLSVKLLIQYIEHSNADLLQFKFRVRNIVELPC